MFALHVQAWSGYLSVSDLQLFFFSRDGKDHFHCEDGRLHILRSAVLSKKAIYCISLFSCEHSIFKPKRHTNDHYPFFFFCFFSEKRSFSSLRKFTGSLGNIRITSHKIFDLFISYFNRYSSSHTPWLVPLNYTEQFEIAGEYHQTAVFIEQTWDPPACTVCSLHPEWHRQEKGETEDHHRGRELKHNKTVQKKKSCV